ncbi:MAG: hypothetical protein MI750_16060, partial [Xanthomonadales bacterium]|nr:hypothetical protein [Xanthomonadales bacterium]
MLLSFFSDFKIRLTINSLLTLLFAFCSQPLSAQEIDRDAVAEIAAELAERNGRVDADALLNAITEFQTQQIWPPSDADMVEQGSCGGESHNCIPSSEDTDTNLPQVQNVHIIYLEGGNTTVGNDFKVEWDHPEPLPDHSLYALSHYEVYLSLNDSEYERFDVAPRVTSDGAVKLKHSIRFRQRSVGTYEVQVRASYRLKSADSPSQSNTDSLNGIIGGQRGSNTRSNGYLNSSWSKGGFGDVQTPTTVQDLSSINNELHQCLLPIYGQNRALSEILFVDCRNRSLSSLLGLQYFSALRGLVVSNDLDSAGNPISNRNTFTSLSPIYELADLVSLNLSATDVAAVEITAAIS